LEGNNVVSVITPSVRKEALEIVAKSLQKQTWDLWEWLICSPFDPEIPWATWIPDKFEGGFWTLNRAYNALIEQAKGSLIVSWQDSIYVPPEGIESFWESFLATEGQSVISGVGDQYDSLDSHQKPFSKVWNDPRKTLKHGTFYETTPDNAEWNWLACPKAPLQAIGGFDEELDFRGFGMDGYQVNERLDALGCKFFLDQTNESYTLRHDRDSHGGQENWDKNNNLSNGEYEKRRTELREAGQWPILNVDKSSPS